MTDARRAGVVVLVLLLGGGIVLTAIPSLGAVRLSGVGLTWWYGVVVAPLLAALITGVALAAGGPLVSTAAWTSPALVAVLLARVFTGEPGAPLLALLSGVAPLLVLLLPSADGRRQVAAATTLGAGLVLWASVLVAGDLAAAIEGERWPGLLLAGALGLAAGLAPVRRVRTLATVIGVATLAAPLLVSIALGAPSPWRAWNALASQPALVFSPRSAGVSDGVVVTTPTTLPFREPHRITAMSDGVFRVVERDGGRLAVREWRLAPGDALTLRPGDRLELDAGARVRFEPGRRVPGAASSGVAWADPREPDSLGAVADGLGAALTLVGGAVALAVRGRGIVRRGASAAAGRRVAARLGAAISVPLASPLLVVAAVGWAVYGAAAAADATLGAPAVAMLVALPSALPAAPWAPLLVAAALAGLAALFLATAGALHERVMRLRGPARGSLGRHALWAGVVAAAVLGATWPVDPWPAFLLACGLAASAMAAPRLAASGATARLAGALVGATLFGVLTIAGSRLLPGTAVVEYPALLAAPAGWAVAAALGARGRAWRRARAVDGIDSVAARGRG